MVRKARKVDRIDVSSVPEAPPGGSMLPAIVEAPQGDLRIPEPGDYWRARGDVKLDRAQNSWNADVSVAKGTVLLVDDVRFVSGSVHSISLAPHPLHGCGGLLMFDAFMRHFEFEPDGDAVRAAEIAALQTEMDEEQSALRAGPSAADLGDAGTVAAVERPALPSGVTFKDLTVPAVRQALETAASQQLSLATAKAAWLSTRSQALATIGSQISSFYAEQSAAALARVKPYETFSNEIRKRVASLNLYIGTDVNVEVLAEGASADPALPLSIFQERRYVEEEWAAYLALLGRGEKAARKNLYAALGASTSLRDRLLPTPRCVIAIRQNLADVRPGSDQPEDPTRLLIRDGENIRLIDIPFDPQRLFPNSEEREGSFSRRGSWRPKLFRGATLDDDDRIDMNEPKYFEALQVNERALAYYRRVLVVLWGLNDRENAFGQFFDGSKYPDGFMSLELQFDRINFIADEDALALTDGHTAFPQWMAEMNSFARSGSRILFNSSDYRDGEFRNYYGGDRKPANEVRARTLKGVLVVMLRRRQWSGREVNTPMPVERICSGDNALVVDGLKLSEVERYIGDRRVWRNYRVALRLLTTARDLLLKEGPLDAMIERIAAEAKVSSHYASRGLIAWRRRNDWRLPKETAEFSAAARLASNTEDKIADDVVRAEAAARLHNRRPIQLVRRLDDTLVLWAEPAPDEVPFAGLVPYPWIASMEIPDSGTAPSAEFELYSSSVGELVEYQWPDVTAPESHEYYRVPYARKALLEVAPRINNAPEALDIAWGHDQEMPGEFATVLAAAKAREKSRWYPENDAAAIFVPIGIAEVKDRGHGTLEYYALGLIEYTKARLVRAGPDGVAAAKELFGDKLNVRDARKSGGVRLSLLRMRYDNDCTGFAGLPYDIRYNHGVAGMDYMSLPGASTGWKSVSSQIGTLIDQQQVRTREHDYRALVVGDGVRAWLLKKASDES